MNFEDTTLAEPVQHFTFEFSAEDITASDILRGMGYVDKAPVVPFMGELKRLLREAPLHVQMEGGFRVFPPEVVELDKARFRIAGQDFEAGPIIAGALRGSEALAFFVATAGPGIGEWSHALAKKNEDVLAYFVDALGSEAVEQAAGYVGRKLETWAAGRGQQITHPYSPGYCQWDIREQHKLFDMLPEQFCGITLTESALMQPTKSVSGVIGIGIGAKKRAYGCRICGLENCYRRNVREGR